MTEVLKCNCQNEFQDNTYGKGMRLHSLGQSKGKKNGKAFCTVCKSQKTINVNVK